MFQILLGLDEQHDAVPPSTSDSTVAGEAAVPPPPATPSTVTTSMTAKAPAYTSDDPGCWGEITDEARSYWIHKGPVSCQNRTASFAASERQYKHQKRSFSKSLFTKSLGNGEAVPREWLLYSPSKGAAFCFVCLLFQEKQEQRTHFSSVCGYKDWKHANERVIEHESSEVHRKRMLTWITRTAEKGHVDCGLRQQFTQECQYWKDVLERVVAVVKFISERGLSFRGGDERFGSVNNGNYMGLLELVSQFDPFLKEHITRFGNAGRGNPSYLSSTICEEFVNLMGDKVLSEIINQIKLAKYFSISVDSTPDISHIDQLTVIMRYVSPEGAIEERFLEFLPIISHTGESLFHAVTAVLERMGIDIENCRGQCYDNATNMSGAYKGVQSRIRELNPLAEWIPCAAHTLNLVGVNTVNCCLETEEVFSFIQSLFNFFSRSPSRWQILTNNLKPNESNRIETLKSLSDTRWSAHASAAKAVYINYENILQSLHGISEDDTQNLSTRSEASALCSIMKRLETAFLCTFWSSVLQRFQNVSMHLQEVALDLSAAVGLVASLRDYVACLRDHYDLFEAKAKGMSPSVSETYRRDKQRERRRTRQADEPPGPDGQQNMSGKEKFSVNVFTVIVDKLVAELDRRYQAYQEIDRYFGFLNNIQSLPVNAIRSSAISLQIKYSNDLQDDFAEEMVHFKEFIKKERKLSAREHLQLIRKRNITHVFPNVDIALRIYLTLPVTNASGERSFSKLSLIKNKMRSTMGQNRLSHLIRMSSESDLLRELEFSDVIADFSARKARKKSF